MQMMCVIRCLHWCSCTGIFNLMSFENWVKNRKYCSHLLTHMQRKEKTGHKPQTPIFGRIIRWKSIIIVEGKIRVATKTDDKIIDFDCLPNKKFKIKRWIHYCEDTDLSMYTFNSSIKLGSRTLAMSNICNLYAVLSQLFIKTHNRPFISCDEK